MMMRNTNIYTAFPSRTLEHKWWKMWRPTIRLSTYHTYVMASVKEGLARIRHVRLKQTYYSCYWLYIREPHPPLPSIPTLPYIPPLPIPPTLPHPTLHPSPPQRPPNPRTLHHAARGDREDLDSAILILPLYFTWSNSVCTVSPSLLTDPSVHLFGLSSISPLCMSYGPVCVCLCVP